MFTFYKCTRLARIQIHILKTDKNEENISLKKTE